MQVILYIAMRHVSPLRGSILPQSSSQGFRPGLTHLAPPGLGLGRRDQARRPTSIGGIDAGDSGHNYETCVAPTGLVFLSPSSFPGLPPWANSFRPSGAGPSNSFGGFYSHGIVEQLWLTHSAPPGLDRQTPSAASIPTASWNNYG